MTPKLRLVLIWSGLFLLAFAGGTLLGRFASRDLADNKAMPGMTDAADFWQARDRARNAAEPAQPKPVERFVQGIPEAHDCENCDASVARDRETAAAIAAQYPPLLGDGGSEPTPVVPAP